jgi:hypothetical protein
VLGTAGAGDLARKAARKAVDDEPTMRLPSTADAPQASPELVRPTVQAQVQASAGTPAARRIARRGRLPKRIPVIERIVASLTATDPLVELAGAEDEREAQELTSAFADWLAAAARQGAPVRTCDRLIEPPPTTPNHEMSGVEDTEDGSGGHEWLGVGDGPGGHELMAVKDEPRGHEMSGVKDRAGSHEMSGVGGVGDGSGGHEWLSVDDTEDGSGGREWLGVEEESGDHEMSGAGGLPLPPSPPSSSARCR